MSVFPIIPWHRIAYDVDGTTGFHVELTSFGTWSPDVSTVTDMTSMLQSMNLETNSRAYNFGDPIFFSDISEDDGAAGVLLFGRVYDIDAISYQMTDALDFTIKMMAASSDTITGLDGSWTDYGEAPRQPHFEPDEQGYWIDNYYREFLTPIGHTAARGFRWAIRWASIFASANFWRLHVYGSVNTAANPDRIIFIDQLTGLEFAALKDWGDRPRGMVDTMTMKVKNNSATLTANNVLLSHDSWLAGHAAWFDIKETAGAYADTLNITSIAPGVTYPSGGNVITVKLDIPAGGDLGPVNTARTLAEVGSWT